MNLNTLEKIVFLLFFISCLLQVIPENREDYPFSFFGMYRYKELGTTYKILPQFTDKKGETYNLYNCISDYRFVLRNHLLESLLKKRRSLDKVTLSKLSPLKGDPLHINKDELQTIFANAQKIVKALSWCPPEFTSTSVTVMGWNELGFRNYKTPDFKEVIRVQ